MIQSMVNSKRYVLFANFHKGIRISISPGQAVWGSRIFVKSNMGLQTTEPLMFISINIIFTITRGKISEFSLSSKRPPLFPYIILIRGYF